MNLYKYLLVVSFTVLALTVQSQFQEIPNPNTNFIYGWEFVNGDTGIYLYENGTTFKTANLGADWDSIPSGFQSWLNTVHYVTDEIAYVGGGANFPFPPSYLSNLILKTTDGGLSYDSLFADMSASDIQQIEFLDTQKGMFIGAFTSFKTTDGGITLDTLHLEPNNFSFTIRNGLEMINEQLIYLAFTEYTGANTFRWKIIMTTDFGESWSTIYDENKVGSYRAVALDFEDEDNGICVGPSGAIAITQNGGATWQNYTVDTAYHLSDVRYLDNNRIIACGHHKLDMDGYVFISEDGGIQWEAILVAAGKLLNKLTVNDDHVFVGGGEGVYKSHVDSLFSIQTDFSELIPSQVSIFPNPAKHRLNIVTEANTAITSFVIVDVFGNIIEKKEFFDVKYAIDIKNYPAGVYFIQLYRLDQKVGGQQFIVR